MKTKTITTSSLSSLQRAVGQFIMKARGWSNKPLKYIKATADFRKGRVGNLPHQDRGEFKMTIKYEV